MGSTTAQHPKVPKMDMAALALAVIGEFSRVQEAIDELVRTYVWQKARGLIPFLQEEHILDRNTDKQRRVFVKALADELKSTADVSNFKDVFCRVKETRDHLAHATSNVVIDANTLRVSKGFAVGPLTAEKKMPHEMNFKREKLATSLHEARWLWHHVMWLSRALQGVNKSSIKVGSEWKELTRLQPPASPRDWDGIFSTYLP